MDRNDLYQIVDKHIGEMFDEVTDVTSLVNGHYNKDSMSKVREDMVNILEEFANTDEGD